MQAYIIRRLLYMVPLLLGISMISFFVIQLAPGDHLGELRLNPQINPETIEAMRAQYGLDKPAWQQYLTWLQRLVTQFDMGRSFQYHAPVTHVIGTRAMNTIILAVVSSVLAWLIALPIGIHAARNQYSWSDKLLTGVAFFGISIPNFFLALLLLYLVVRFGIPLPIGGATSVGYEELGFFERIWDRIRHLVVPTLVLTTASTAGLMRYMRGSLLETLRQDYVVTARAKGLQEQVVVYKHAVRNAINPLITIFGFEIGNILGGAALVEIVSGYPGLGSVIYFAVRAMDYHLVMGALMISGVLLIMGNLVADVLLAWSDPRIRYD